MRALSTRPSPLTSRNRAASIEPLEQRSLLSWTPADDFVQPLSNPQGEYPESYAIPWDMAADAGGGVYVAGESWDYSLLPNDRGYAVLRYKSGTDTGFQTIATIESTSSWFAARFSGVATAPDDSVYLCGLTGPSTHRVWKGSWDASRTTLSLAEVDTQSLIAFRDVTVDGAGNVFALGQYTTNNGTVHWVVRKQTAGQGAFVTVNDFVYGSNTSAYPSGITAVRSGTSAGVYVTGRTSSRWLVRKSTNAGSTWSTADAFQLEPSTNAPAAATAFTAHEDGTLHVVGRASARVQTGGTPRKPTYSYVSRWFMRSSSNAGLTWTNHDVHPSSTGVSTDYGPNAVSTDIAGNVYVAGVSPSGSASRGIVRTNAGGAWSTSDDFAVDAALPDSRATSMTRDSNGTLYVGGDWWEPAPTYNGHWIVRSMNATAAHVGGTVASIFAESLIAVAHEDELAELV